MLKKKKKSKCNVSFLLGSEAFCITWVEQKTLLETGRSIPPGFFFLFKNDYLHFKKIKLIDFKKIKIPKVESRLTDAEGDAPLPPPYPGDRVLFLCVFSLSLHYFMEWRMTQKVNPRTPHWASKHFRIQCFRFFQLKKTIPGRFSRGGVVAKSIQLLWPYGL